MARPLALLREVPDSFSRALRDPGGPAIDVGRARAQHAAYRAALEDGGFATVVLAADPDRPDCPFVEDTAVVIGRRALATRPGHPDRRGEVGSVADALRRWVAVTEMGGAATLDGGDVLQVGRSVFVGRSSRTNAAGIAALARFAGADGRRVVPVEVDGVLHLKSAATAIDAHTVLVWPDAVEVGAFAGLDVMIAPGDDPHAANVVRLPDGRLLITGDGGEPAAVLGAAGRPVLWVDVGEFATAGGGLTCLSIRLRSVLADGPT